MDYDEINKLAQDNGIELQGTDDKPENTGKKNK